ncbi:hypothetical protein Q7P37_005795 [Cladosporium fusiforme]
MKVASARLYLQLHASHAWPPQNPPPRLQPGRNIGIWVNSTGERLVDHSRQPHLHPLTTAPRLFSFWTLSRAVMDFMKAGEAMLRSSQPLLPFLAPAAYRQPARRVAFVSRHCGAQPMQASLSRSFATSMRTRQEDKTPKSPAKPTTSATEDISSILDGALDGSKGTPTTPTARTTRFASNNAQSESSPSRKLLPRSSVDDLLANMGNLSTSPRGKRDVLGSLNPRGARNAPPTLPQPAPMKLGPKLGRTVYVEPKRGIDVARAFRSMEIGVAKNQVKKDFNRQRFHERGGVKRKRLHSERWRKRFKAGFQATVKRVLKMKKQGW